MYKNSIALCFKYLVVLRSPGSSEFGFAKILWCAHPHPPSCACASFGLVGYCANASTHRLWGRCGLGAYATQAVRTNRYSFCEAGHILIISCGWLAVLFSYHRLAYAHRGVHTYLRICGVVAAGLGCCPPYF